MQDTPQDSSCSAQEADPIGTDRYTLNGHLSELDLGYCSIKFGRELSANIHINFAETWSELQWPKSATRVTQLFYSISFGPGEVLAVILYLRAVKLVLFSEFSHTMDGLLVLLLDNLSGA